VDGVVTEEKVETGDKKKKNVKVLRKIPPSVIASAKGLAIFTSMRSGIAPLGGAGGAGIVVAKLPDGSKSGPHRSLDPLLTDQLGPHHPQSRPTTSPLA
jgi:lipid-binding SYLF domain-containing protein